MPDKQEITDSALADIHRRASAETSPAALDAAVLQAARKALETGNSQTQKPRHWPVNSLALAATLVVGVAVAWRVVQVPMEANTLAPVEQADSEITAAPESNALRKAAEVAGSELDDLVTQDLAERAEPVTSAPAPNDPLADIARERSQTNALTQRAERGPAVAAEQRNLQATAEDAEMESGAFRSLAPAAAKLGNNEICPDAGEELALWRKCLTELRTAKELAQLQEAEKAFRDRFPGEALTQP